MRVEFSFYFCMFFKWCICVLVKVKNAFNVMNVMHHPIMKENGCLAVYTTSPMKIGTGT